ncbi:hypothetical protein NAPIS_ORF02671 [Vairimorpha apis BRL 01]|uniref:Uncharacterized protein n=1 Tax=Vairimorpha apis BRL 01 TaxID=1037528 RepID=T0KWA3_9MICR|nr:hypothetical protein NAPIS_ORF02671 [Vairimorpha apis BRL 01]
MTKTNCTYDQALEADEKANGNIDEAISIIQNEVYVGNGQAVASAPDCDYNCDYENYSGNKYNNENTNKYKNSNKYRNTNKYRNSENTNKYNSGNSNSENNNK